MDSAIRLCAANMQFGSHDEALKYAKHCISVASSEALDFVLHPWALLPCITVLPDVECDRAAVMEHVTAVMRHDDRDRVLAVLASQLHLLPASFLGDWAHCLSGDVSAAHREIGICWAAVLEWRAQLGKHHHAQQQHTPTYSALTASLREGLARRLTAPLPAGSQPTVHSTHVGSIFTALLGASTGQGSARKPPSLAAAIRRGVAASCPHGTEQGTMHVWDAVAVGVWGHLLHAAHSEVLALPVDPPMLLLCPSSVSVWLAVPDLLCGAQFDHQTTQDPGTAPHATCVKQLQQHMQSHTVMSSGLFLELAWCVADCPIAFAVCRALHGVTTVQQAGLGAAIRAAITCSRIASAPTCGIEQPQQILEALQKALAGSAHPGAAAAAGSTETEHPMSAIAAILEQHKHTLHERMEDGPLQAFTSVSSLTRVATGNLATAFLVSCLCIATDDPAKSVQSEADQQLVMRALCVFHAAGAHLLQRTVQHSAMQSLALTVRTAQQPASSAGPAGTDSKVGGAQEPAVVSGAQLRAEVAAKHRRARIQQRRQALIGGRHAPALQATQPPTQHAHTLIASSAAAELPAQPPQAASPVEPSSSTASASASASASESTAAQPGQAQAAYFASQEQADAMAEWVQCLSHAVLTSLYDRPLDGGCATDFAGCAAGQLLQLERLRCRLSAFDGPLAQDQAWLCIPNHPLWQPPVALPVLGMPTLPAAAAHSKRAPPAMAGSTDSHGAVSDTWTLGLAALRRHAAMQRLSLGDVLDIAVRVAGAFVGAAAAADEQLDAAKYTALQAVNTVKAQANADTYSRGRRAELLLSQRKSVRETTEFAVKTAAASIAWQAPEVKIAAPRVAELQAAASSGGAAGGADADVGCAGAAEISAARAGVPSAVAAVSLDCVLTLLRLAQDMTDSLLAPADNNPAHSPSKSAGLSLQGLLDTVCPADDCAWEATVVRGVAAVAQLARQTGNNALEHDALTLLSRRSGLAVPRASLPGGRLQPWEVRIVQGRQLLQTPAVGSWSSLCATLAHAAAQQELLQWSGQAWDAPLLRLALPGVPQLLQPPWAGGQQASTADTTSTTVSPGQRTKSAVDDGAQALDLHAFIAQLHRAWQRQQAHTHVKCTNAWQVVAQSLIPRDKALIQPPGVLASTACLRVSIAPPKKGARGGLQSLPEQLPGLVAECGADSAWCTLSQQGCISVTLPGKILQCLKSALCALAQPPGAALLGPNTLVLPAQPESLPLAPARIATMLRSRALAQLDTVLWGVSFCSLLAAAVQMLSPCVWADARGVGTEPSLGTQQYAGDSSGRSDVDSDGDVVASDPSPAKQPTGASGGETDDAGRSMDPTHSGAEASSPKRRRVGPSKRAEPADPPHGIDEAHLPPVTTVNILPQQHPGLNGVRRDSAAAVACSLLQAAVHACVPAVHHRGTPAQAWWGETAFLLHAMRGESAGASRAMAVLAAASRGFPLGISAMHAEEHLAQAAEMSPSTIQATCLGLALSALQLVLLAPPPLLPGIQAEDMLAMISSAVGSAQCDSVVASAAAGALSALQATHGGLQATAEAHQQLAEAVGNLRDGQQAPLRAHFSGCSWAEVGLLPTFRLPCPPDTPPCTPTAVLSLARPAEGAAYKPAFLHSKDDGALLQLLQDCLPLPAAIQGRHTQLPVAASASQTRPCAEFVLIHGGVPRALAHNATVQHDTAWRRLLAWPLEAMVQCDAGALLAAAEEEYRGREQLAALLAAGLHHDSVSLAATARALHELPYSDCVELTGSGTWGTLQTCFGESLVWIQADPEQLQAAHATGKGELQDPMTQQW